MRSVSPHVDSSLVRVSPRAGLTLIELVIVLLIVAVLAGLVVPQVAMLGRSADMAGSLSSQKELAKNIQYHFASLARYPQGLDSLLESNGSAPTGVYVPDAANPQTSGLPSNAISFPNPTYTGNTSATLHSCLAQGTLTNATGAEYLRSFSRSGFDWVYDHDRAIINSNNSAVYQRLVSASSSFAVAEVVSGSPLARALLPGTLGVIPPNERLIALGVGPRSSMVPNTMVDAPIYPTCDGSYYGRYVAVFRVYASGERAILVTVVDSYGRWPDYTTQQFIESLPNGRRPG